MKTILFQGDSITDCGRSYEDNEYLGIGYPHLTAAELGFENPGSYRFYNRGISGNRIVDVYARIKADIINLKPDIMSILIGVNDVWHELSSQNGVDAEKYFKIYSMLIEEVKAVLPDVKIMIMEPYVLKGRATCENWDYFKTEVSKRAEKAKEIAEKYGLKFVPLQDVFDGASRLAPPEYWSADGVHPTKFGHELIKREWIKAFRAL
ncbi:MAG: SGNH/GDSL hydrolase family protein [Clostridiales bacterium]|nr:SGNH/GDSL hydrolase family protein [Clostridiales bacterium]